MDLLLVCLFSTGYNIVHYQFYPEQLRSLYFFIIEILRTNVMVLLTFYYLKMASSLLKNQYQCFKYILAISYIVLMVMMTECGITLVIKQQKGLYKWNSLCSKIQFLALRWGPVIISFFFLIITFSIHCMIGKQFKKRDKNL